ncbi:MAG: hypothetical protein U0441_28710 [Polyangiaceae bacterium]
MKSRSFLMFSAATLASGLGCQALYEKNDLTVATGGSGGSTASGGTTSTTTGGTTSMGGTTSSGGSTGGPTSSGGTTSSGGSSGGTTSMGGTTSSGGSTGGTTTTTTTTSSTVSCDDPLFVIGVSATTSKAICAAHQNGAWAGSTYLQTASSGAPTAAMVDGQNGVGVYYGGGVPGPLRAIQLTNGACSAPADIPTISTRAAPSSAVLAGTVHLVFLGAVGAGDYHPFTRLWTAAGGWAAGAQIGSFTGGAVSGVGRSGAEMLAVHGRTPDSAVGRTLFSNGAWGAEDCFQTGCPAVKELTKNNIPPAVTGLPGGGWLVVFQDYDPGTPKLRWATFKNGVASGSTVLQDAALSTYPDSSTDPPSLWQTADGAVLAYRGKNNEVVTGFYSAATDTWSPKQLVAGSTTTAAPSVAQGACSHIAYVDGVDGTVRHCTSTGAAWTCDATAISAEPMTGVALASPP